VVDDYPEDDNRDELMRTQVSTCRISEDPAAISEDEQRVPVLIVLQGQEIGRRYLINEAELVMGRHPRRADLLIRGDLEISSMHVRLEKTGGAFLLTDLGSTNGTTVNGRPLRPEDPVTLQDGDRIFFGSTVLTFTYQDTMEEDFHVAVERMMNIDDLTGLVVKRSFDRQFEWTLKANQSSPAPVTILMMDMDGLKKINDAHGHHVGASCISQVGRILGEIVNPRGCVTRFGGDEFTAYLDRCTRVDGLTVAEQIRRRIEDHEFRVDEVVAHPTISIGLSSLPEDGDQPAELVRAADEALYRAKAKGRNCVSE